MSVSTDLQFLCTSPSFFRSISNDVMLSNVETSNVLVHSSSSSDSTVDGVTTISDVLRSAVLVPSYTSSNSFQFKPFIGAVRDVEQQHSVMLPLNSLPCSALSKSSSTTVIDAILTPQVHSPECTDLFDLSSLPPQRRLDTSTQISVGMSDPGSHFYAPSMSPSRNTPSLCLSFRLTQFFEFNSDVTEFNLYDKLYEYKKEAIQKHQAGQRYNANLLTCIPMYWKLGVKFVNKHVEVKGKACSIRHMVFRVDPVASGFNFDHINAMNMDISFIRDHFWVSNLTKDVYLRHPSLDCYFMVFKAVRMDGTYMTPSDAEVSVIPTEESTLHFDFDVFVDPFSLLSDEVHRKMKQFKEYTKTLNDERTRLQLEISSLDDRLMHYRIERSNFEGIYHSIDTATPMELNHYRETFHKYEVEIDHLEDEKCVKVDLLNLNRENIMYATDQLEQVSAILHTFIDTNYGKGYRITSSYLQTYND